MTKQSGTPDLPDGNPSPALAASGSALERRAAALIAYLAVEGPTVRSKLAGLLWPDSSEATARNNLSQTLRRLRQSGQATMLVGDDPLRLDPPLDADEALMLLRPHDYDDLSDFDDWRLAVQERRRAVRVAALRSEVSILEAAGDLRSALDLAEVWLDLDPVSEVAHRQLMRLHHLLGDRAGALAAYHRCQAVLRRELGLGPGPETVALAREVERSAVPVPITRALPLSVQRPPRLVGRAAAWQLMERAWQEGRGVILSGVPGVGKTRLMRDFMAAHGQRVFFEARPGDRQLPYSTHARTFAALLRQFPDLVLPDWVRRELARIVPGLGEAPPPIASDADKLRFYQAKTEVLRLAAAAGMGALAFDDLQFIDAASAEAGEYTLSEFWGDEYTDLRTIHAFRTDELTPDVQARLDGLVAAGLSVHVELSPLSASDVDELLTSLEVPEVAQQSAAIALVSGGNPLVVLESVRHLLGQEGGTLSGRLPTLLAGRLTRLSPAALSLARAAAVLGADFGPEAAAAMLDQAPLDLAPAWQELEAAQVLRGQAFTHDLLAEGVLGGLPEALGELLHRRAAAALEPSRQAPARIAGHWAAGGEVGRAATWWLRAGEEAQAHYRHLEAAELYGQAWEASTDHDERFGAGLRLAKLLGEGQPDDQLISVVSRLLAQSRTPAEHAAAHAAECQLLGLQGKGATLEASAREGLSWSVQDAEHPFEVELLSYLGTGLFFQRRMEEALTAFRETAQLAEQTHNLMELGIAVDNMATVLGHLNRRQEALEPLRQVERRLAEAGLISQQAAVLIGLGNIERFCGRQALAMAILDQAWTLLDSTDGSGYVKLLCALSRVICARLLERYELALQMCEHALQLDHAASVMRPLLQKEQAHLYLLLGADALARGSLQRARVAGVEGDDTAYPEVVAIQQQVLEALLDLRQGGDVSRALARLQAEAQRRDAPLSDRAAIALAFAPMLPPAESLALTEGLPEQALEAELFGLRLALLVRRAQAHLALDQLDAAGDALREVIQADPEVWPASSRTEVLFTQARVLSRQRDPSAPAALQAARTELLRVADQQVPPEFRASFLALPLHMELLAESDPERPAWRPLTDAQWASVEALLSAGGPGTGRPRRDTRAVLDGVRWALATGAAWNRPFPAHLPSAATCYRRYREWQAQGVLAEVERRLSEPGR